MFSLKPPIPKPKAQKDLPKFNWLMFILLVALPIVVIPTFIVTLAVHGGWLYYGSMFVITYAMCILSIGIYHRYWTHRSFVFKNTKISKTVEFAMRFYGVTVGSLSGQGDGISWALRHWKHHLVEDVKGKDHHTPLEFKNKFLGFIWSHVGWMCYIELNKFDYNAHSQSKRDELEADKLLVWQRKYYVVLYTFFAAVFPFILGAIISPDFWMMVTGNAFNGINLAWHMGLTFLTINAARMTCQHATFLVNSLCHIQGHKPYQNHKTGQATDNWLVAILVFGEGFHNGHHAFGYSYEHGIIHEGNKGSLRAKLMYMLDFHARIIDLMDKCGLLKFKLKPSDAEVSMVMQKRVFFELEEKFETLKLELSKKTSSMQSQISNEVDVLRAKFSDVSDDYEKALEQLIERLKRVIETCHEKIRYYSEKSQDLTNLWRARLEKAEAELLNFKMQLKAQTC